MVRVRRTIRSAAPEAEEVISYRMPAIRQNRILVYYGAFSTHCSLFVASAAARKHFATELRPFASGRGTYRFTPKHPIPLGLIARIVRFRVAETAGRPARPRPRAAGRTRSRR